MPCCGFSIYCEILMLREAESESEAQSLRVQTKDVKRTRLPIPRRSGENLGETLIPILQRPCRHHHKSCLCIIPQHSRHEVCQCYFRMRTLRALSQKRKPISTASRTHIRQQITRSRHFNPFRSITPSLPRPATMEANTGRHEDANQTPTAAEAAFVEGKHG